jgi:hypothetical protein
LVGVCPGKAILAPVTENITPEREVAEAISLLKQT